jgi:DNA-nicking Smr family endonuclease
VTKKKDISIEDINTWQNYIKNPKDVIDKDSLKQNKQSIENRFRYDLHGFSLKEANDKVKQIILSCVKNHYKEILLITGKGIHSNTSSDVYVSRDLSKLRFSVPEFINNDAELSCYVNSISTASKVDGGEGAIVIKLKNLQNKF